MKKKIIKLHNKNMLVVEEKISWSFKLLEEKLFRKLKYLALVNVLRKKQNEKVYYKYTNITYYELRDFSQFISLIKVGDIKIKFNVVELTQSDGSKKIYDHGTSFDLNLVNINKLFKKI